VSGPPHRRCRVATGVRVPYGYRSELAPSNAELDIQVNFQVF